jgi:hypothetical protein
VTALSQRPSSPALADPQQLAKERVQTSAALWFWAKATLGALPSPVPMDATDEKLYQDALRPLAERIRDGQLRAEFHRQEDKSLLYVGGSGQVWEVIYFLRNAEFRPKPAALAAEVRKSLRLPAQGMSGAEAEAARPFVAPLRPNAGIVPDVEIDPEAEWVGEFADRIGTGDVERDSVMLRILGHVGSDGARSRIMDGIEAARATTKATGADSQSDRDQRRADRASRASSTRRAAEIVARRILDRAEGKVTA